MTGQKNALCKLISMRNAREKREKSLENEETSMQNEFNGVKYVERQVCVYAKG